MLSLPHDHAPRERELGENGWLGPIQGEGVVAVVHDGAVVVGSSEGVDVVGGVGLEVVLVFWNTSTCVNFCYSGIYGYKYFATIA